MAVTQPAFGSGELTATCAAPVKHLVRTYIEGPAVLPLEQLRFFTNKGGDADWTGLIAKPDAPRCYDEAPGGGENAWGFLLSPCRVMSSRAAGDCRGALVSLGFCRGLSRKRKPRVTL
jgi:hypothetical protein